MESHGIGTRGQSPEDVESLGGVDVVVHHDDIASEVGAGVHLRSHEAGLARVARIALLDGDDVQQTATARLVAPHALDVRNPRLLHLGPQMSAAFTMHLAME